MMSLAELANRPMVWVVGEGPDWTAELRAGGDLAGSLRFETESRAVGELAGRTWVLQREGPLFDSHIVVRSPESRELVATYTPGWASGGMVEFRSGVRYCWNPSHIWSTTYCFRRESKAASVCVSQGPVSKSGSALKICTDAAGLAETPVLVLLGGFLEVLRVQRLMSLAEV